MTALATPRDAIGFALSPASLWSPDYLCPSAWHEHGAFAFWLFETLRPRVFVELGTQAGFSYFAFCQANQRLDAGAACYAVDTWRGDEHAGHYGEEVFQSVAAKNRDAYAGFSTLLRCTFEEALGYFPDGSVDLLHIDGRHYYDDVHRDFETWRPKLAADAVVLFHDTNVRERGFGVWRLFDELAAKHPAFHFLHGHGLGIVAPMAVVPARLAPLFDLSEAQMDLVRALYARLGATIAMQWHGRARDRALDMLADLGPQTTEQQRAMLAKFGAYDRQVGALMAATDRRDAEIRDTRTRLAAAAALLESQGASPLAAPPMSRPA